LCAAAPKGLGAHGRANIDFWAKPKRHCRKGGIPMDHTTAFTALLTLFSFSFVAAIILGMF
jgi:hypothetical protein